MQSPFQRGGADDDVVAAGQDADGLHVLREAEHHGFREGRRPGALVRCRHLLVLSYSDKKTAPSMRGEHLRAYVRELDAVAPHFDAAIARTGRKQLCLAWHEAGPFSLRRTYTSLAVEETRAAAEEDRREPDGIRRACAALCDAAGFLRASASEGSSSGDKASSGGDRLKHVSGACMAAFEVLVLAHALECYFELAVAGGKPLALCAKIACRGTWRRRPIWTRRGWCTRRRRRPTSEATRVLREKDDGDGEGEAIARLRQGLESLDVAKGTLWKVAGPVQDATKRLRKEIETALAAGSRRRP